MKEKSQPVGFTVYRLGKTQINYDFPKKHEESCLDVEVDVLEPLLDIEAGAGLLDPGEVSVADNLGFGIVRGQTLEEIL